MLLIFWTFLKGGFKMKKIRKFIKLFLPLIPVAIIIGCKLKNKEKRKILYLLDKALYLKYKNYY